MIKIISKIKDVLKNEDGGPNLEAVINMSVALIVATAIMFLGNAMASWIAGAKDYIDNLRP